MEEFISEYFRYLESEYPEEAAKEYKSRLLSIDEMRTIFENRWNDEGCHSVFYIDLQLDAKSGLYFVNHNFTFCEDLLSNHLLVEQLYKQKEKVDWKRVTNCYDFKVLKKIEHLLNYPLVWIPTEDVGSESVVVGKVAKELYPPERFVFLDNRRQFYNQMRDEGLLWFADNLPVAKDIYDPDGYDNLPETMPLWDRLLYGGYSDLHRTMEFIVDNRGYAKAIEIIERFQADWDSIMTLRLFDFWRLDDYEKERYRMDLFDRIEPYMRGWKTKIQSVHKNDSLTLQSLADVHYHINSPVGQIINNIQGDYVAGDKHVGTHIDNVESGGIGAKTTKE